MAILIVMLLLSITLGLSYAMVRSQTTALQVQQNANVRVSARRAALTGLTVALKEMHTSEWCYGDGVDTVLTGRLSDHETYRVVYESGDDSLEVPDPSDSEAWARYAVENACRVTLRATGKATDPSAPERTSKHRAHAVVRLLPRAMGRELDDWDKMQQYTVYQAKQDDFEIDIPCRIEGPVRTQGWLKIAPHYPDRDGDAPCKAYLEHLNLMRSDGYPDYRPFAGPLYFSTLSEDVLILLLRWVDLGITPQGVSSDQAAHVGSDPPCQTTYQVYPGGPDYTIPSLGGMLENTTREPDPIANPLGIYLRSGTLELESNVTVRGSVFCTGDIRIQEENVRFKPVELPGLDGSDTPVRLPAAYCKDFIVENGGGGAVEGLVCAYNELRIDKSPHTTEFGITGRAIVSKLKVKERHPWQDADWNRHYWDFRDQSTVPYFPVWMAQRGYDPKPRITFTPDDEPVTYHWKDPRDPVYTPHADDDGLRWDLLEWTDGS